MSDPTIAPATETEIICFLDTTGSMTYGVSATDSTPRNAVLGEAFSIIVERLAAADSQAAHEEGGGGLYLITWTNGHATDVGDVNPSNVRKIWNGIKWGGGTVIMPGYNKVLEVYRREFGRRPIGERPALCILGITDGEAADYEDFVNAISSLDGNTYLKLAILGYGAEHDKAFEAYKKAAKQNPAHVTVSTFGSETNPEDIANGLLAMMD